MNRRNFIRQAGVATTGFAVTGCLPRAMANPALTARRRANLVPPTISWDRVIRTTVGLRPHRDSGFVVRADRLDEKTVIHNYGHGGTGYSLSWGTAQLATELALEGTERRAAVIGCGIVGLTTARQLQRHGFDVTIYAASLPPETTSNMAWAAFTTLSGLVSPERRTADWDAQFQRAVTTSYRQHQLLAGNRYGVSWIDEYTPTNNPSGPRRGADEGGPGLMPDSLTVKPALLNPGEHPFSTSHAYCAPNLRFEPSIYLDALMRDVVAFGGRITGDRSKPSATSPPFQKRSWSTAPGSAQKLSSAMTSSFRSKGN